MSEPLVLLMLMSAVALAVLSPVLHCHQFGEATRTACDAGLSAMILGGAVVAIFAGVSAIRSEIETGTVVSALSRPVSRTLFFSAKVTGALLVMVLFALAVTSASLAVVNGAAIGGKIAEANGTVVKVWGPSFVFAIAPIVIAPLAAALMNRVWNFRFTLSATLILAVLAFLSLAYRPDFSLYLRVAPVCLLSVVPAFALVGIAAASAVRLSSHVAFAISGLAALLMLPSYGNYSLSPALAEGMSLPALYVLSAVAAMLALLVGALGVGAMLFKEMDI